MLLTSCRCLVRPLGHRNWLSSTTSFPCGQITDAKRDTVRFEYLPGELRRLRNPFKRTPIAQTVFNRLRDCGILRTFRGCRAGRALKLQNLLGSSNIQSVHQSSQICIPISSRSPHSRLFLSNTTCSGGRRSGFKVKQREISQKSPISTVITHREHESSPRQRGIRTNNLTRIQPHSWPKVVEKSLSLAVINCRSLNKNGFKLKDHIVEHDCDIIAVIGDVAPL